MNRTVRREILQDRLPSTVSDSPLSEAVALYQRMVACPGDAPIDVQRGRKLMLGLLGEIQIAPQNGDLVAKMGLAIQPLSGSSIRGSGVPLWCFQTAG